MPEIISDRVKEQTTSTGVGNITLGGAMTGFRAFSSVCSPNDTFPGTIVAVDNQGNPTGQWETGNYKFVNTTTIERTTVSLSSNNDQKVDFGPGTKHIFIDLTAYKIVAIQGTGLIKNPPGAGGGNNNGGGNNPPPTGTEQNQLRYVRDYVNGSTANGGAHWVELRVIGANGQNISQGKPVTGSNVPEYGALSLLTDGDLNSDNYINISNLNEQWVQVDLGSVQTVQSVTVWHYFADGRTYHGTKTMGSVDGSTWFTIYNSATSGEYPETASGRTFTAPFNGTPTGNTGGNNNGGGTPTGPINTAQFHLGMHAHRLYNGGGISGTLSPAPTYDYGVFRTWDCEFLHDAEIWQSNNTLTEALVEQVFQGHAGNGAKVLHCFGTVPTWASAAPNGDPWDRSPNNPSWSPYGWPGSSSGAADLTLYRSYVRRFVTRFQSYLWAVEGWNEPYPNTPFPSDGEYPQFCTMDITRLADHQKIVYQETKAVNPNILVFSPANAYVGCIPYLLDARTSQGEPMHQFFDVLSWHAYNRDFDGSASEGYTLEWEVGRIREFLTARGLSKPLADTEHGWLQGGKEGGAAFAAMSPAQKGQVLFNTAQKAKQLGLLTICYYSHDDAAGGLIGGPAFDSTVSAALQNIYTQLDTKW